MVQHEATRRGASESERGDRAFVLGLDGVPWELVRRWARRGDLPSFARLLEEGAAGPLESTTPATTPLAWPSICTGTWPDRHGVYAFQRLAADGTHRMNTRQDVERPALWDLVSPSIVGNVPMTYPAAPIDGAMAAGMMAPTVDERWAHPASLAERVTTEIPDYRIGLDWQEYGERRDEFRSDLRSLLASRRRLMELLTETVSDWRLFFFVYTAPDRLQHLIWDEDVLREHYRRLDDVVGDVLEYVERHDATLFVVSDHGFGPVDRTVSLPRVLEREGFLEREAESGSRSTLERVGLTKDTVRSWLDAVGIDDRTVIDYLPQGLVDTVALQIPGDHALYDVDYERTAAFAHGPGNVYVNSTDRFTNGCVDPDDVPGVKRAVADALTDLTDPETGETVLEVRDGDDLFPADDRAPDLVAKGRPRYEVWTRLADEPFVDGNAVSAGHRSEGTFLAWGPSIEAGATPTDATVVDVAPTLLHAIGEPVPVDLDGRVLEAVLTDEVAARPVAQRGAAEAGGTAGDDDVDDETSFEEVEDRLRGLGYLD